MCFVSNRSFFLTAKDIFAELFGIGMIFYVLQTYLIMRRVRQLLVMGKRKKIEFQGKNLLRKKEGNGKKINYVFRF